MSLLTATDILEANLLHESGDESDFDGTGDESEDHEEDEIEFEHEKNNEKNFSEITLTSFVPSIDVHIYNYNEISFIPTFLNDINQIDSTFVEGVQDFDIYAQRLNLNAVQVQTNSINNFIRYETFDLPAFESDLVRSNTVEIPVCGSDMVRSDTFEITAHESDIERPDSNYLINENNKGSLHLFILI